MAFGSATSWPFFVQISSKIVNFVFFVQNAKFRDFVRFSSKTNFLCPYIWRVDCHQKSNIIIWMPQNGHEASLDLMSVSAWTGTSVPRRSPHPSLWCCSSPSLSTFCKPEPSHCASLLSADLARTLARQSGHNSLPDELRNSDSFDRFKRFLKTVLLSRYCVFYLLTYLLTSRCAYKCYKVASHSSILACAVLQLLLALRLHH